MMKISAVCGLPLNLVLLTTAQILPEPLMPYDNHNTVCYGPGTHGQFRPSCPDNDLVIAVQYVKVGTKPKDVDCPSSVTKWTDHTGSYLVDHSNISKILNQSVCCFPDEDRDCTRVYNYANSGLEYKYHISSSGYTESEPNMEVSWAETNCNNTSKYPSGSNFMFMEYSCIERRKIGNMCSNSTYTTTGSAFYLYNTGYPRSMKEAVDVCQCKILTNAANIQFYSIDMRLEKYGNECRQTFNLTDSDGSIVWDCDSALNYNVTKIMKNKAVTVSFNNDLPMDGGHIWIGVSGESGDTITIDCTYHVIAMIQSTDSTNESTYRHKSTTAITESSETTSAGHFTTVPKRESTSAGQNSVMSTVKTTSAGQNSTVSTTEPTIKTTSKGHYSSVFTDGSTSTGDDSNASNNLTTPEGDDSTVSTTETTSAGHDWTVSIMETTSTGQHSAVPTSETTISRPYSTVTPRVTTSAGQDSTYKDSGLLLIVAIFCGLILLLLVIILTVGVIRCKCKTRVAHYTDVETPNGILDNINMYNGNVNATNNGNDSRDIFIRVNETNFANSRHGHGNMDDTQDSINGNRLSETRHGNNGHDSENTVIRTSDGNNRDDNSITVNKMPADKREHDNEIRGNVNENSDGNTAGGISDYNSDRRNGITASCRGKGYTDNTMIYVGDGNSEQCSSSRVEESHGGNSEHGNDNIDDQNIKRQTAASRYTDDPIDKNDFKNVIGKEVHNNQQDVMEVGNDDDDSSGFLFVHGLEHIQEKEEKASVRRQQKRKNRKRVFTKRRQNYGRRRPETHNNKNIKKRKRKTTLAKSRNKESCLQGPMKTVQPNMVGSMNMHARRIQIRTLVINKRHADI